MGLMSAWAVACLGSVFVFSTSAADGLDAILTRVAEEAEAFRQNIPRALTQETLVQTSLIAPGRRLRVGAAAGAPAQPIPRTHEVVSEYSVAPLHDSEANLLVEFRQVLSVDRRPVQSAQSARRALMLGVQSADDRQRKRMLEDFASHGLVDVATDYGLILLEFLPRRRANLEIAVASHNRVGTDDVLVLNWKQKTDESGELEFRGHQAARHRLAGRLWVRESDALPLRVDVWAESRDSARRTIRDEATVDYVRSAHGFLTPASVAHRHLVDGRTITENLYRYESFRLFSSDASIHFEVEEPVKKK